MTQLAWDDPALLVASDTVLQARYRRLQSWHRAHVLGARHAPDGPSGRTAPVGSLLHPDDVAADRSLNLLCDPSILAFTEHRARVVAQEGGMAEQGRLFHNMLSSMPMAFDLAARLSAASEDVAADVLRAVFGIEVGHVEYVTAEWAPRTEARRVGGTAFDLAAVYSGPDGDRCLLGVEVKYTERPPEPSRVRPTWRTRSARCGWFRPGADARLGDRTTNQMWRNTLLAATQEHHVAGPFDRAHLAVVGLAEDDELWALVDDVADELTDDHQDRLVPITWDTVAQRLERTPLADLASSLNDRYLDLSPVTGAVPAAP